MSGFFPTEKPVNCSGCFACCTDEWIFLGDNDDPEQYYTQPAPPESGRKYALAQKPNGDCIYLTQGKCGNYENRPEVCRDYDCRIAFLLWPRKTQERMIAEGTLRREQMQAGKKRQWTLTGRERLSLKAIFDNLKTANKPRKEAQE